VTREDRTTSTVEGAAAAAVRHTLPDWDPGPIPDPCLECGGEGAIEDADGWMLECGVCDGSGIES